MWFGEDANHGQKQQRGICFYGRTAIIKFSFQFELLIDLRAMEVWRVGE